jgi:hypothetical protein
MGKRTYGCDFAMRIVITMIDNGWILHIDSLVDGFEKYTVTLDDAIKEIQKWQERGRGKT